MYTPCGGGKTLPGKNTSGAPSGFTVTWNVQVAELPQLSLAVQVTIVVPIGNVLPEGGLQTTVGVASHPPEAAGLYVTTAPAGPVALTVMSAGQVMLTTKAGLSATI